MTKRFTKGTPVYRFQNWDAKGTVAIEEWVVGSWGAKQGFLTLDGTNAKERVYVEATATSLADALVGHGRMLILPVSEVADPEAVALEMAAAFLVAERASIERCIARNESLGYTSSMKGSLAALHEPRAHRFDRVEWLHSLGIK